MTKGDSGTVLKISYLRETLVQHVTLTKRPVSFPSVKVDSIQGFGHISIFSFTPTTIMDGSTHDEFVRALRQTAHFPLVFLDLRGNGGGTIQEALQISDELISQGVLIREINHTFHRGGFPIRKETIFKAKPGDIGENREYILLVDSKSASSAELMFAALRDNLNITSVGTRTFGKGIGQILLDTPGQGLLRISSAKFLSPNKENYHKVGLVPTHETGLDSILSQALVLARNQTQTPVTKLSASQANNLKKQMIILEFNRQEALSSLPPSQKKLEREGFPASREIR